MTTTRDEASRIGVLFVCMGNICRSPTAEGVFTKLVAAAGLSEHFEIDSAGTHGYHVGAPPDRRAQDTAEAHGISLAALTARPVQAEDFEQFEYIIAMDTDNLTDLRDMAPAATRDRIRLLLFLCQESGCDGSARPVLRWRRRLRGGI